jgi:hypothetical protein
MRAPGAVDNYKCQIFDYSRKALIFKPGARLTPKGLKKAMPRLPTGHCFDDIDNLLITYLFFFFAFFVAVFFFAAFFFFATFFFATFFLAVFFFAAFFFAAKWNHLLCHMMCGNFVPRNR